MLPKENFGGTGIRTRYTFVFLSLFVHETDEYFFVEGRNETHQPLRTATIKPIGRQNCSQSYSTLAKANVYIPSGIVKSQICAKTKSKMRSNTCMVSITLLMKEKLESEVKKLKKCE